jgi:hypothetical protein
MHNRREMVSNTCMRFFVKLVAIAALLTGACQSKVAPTSLESLTIRADLIVIGRVARLVTVKGIQVAEVQVTRTIKGSSRQSVYYLAQPTWICDITSGTVGEDTLFFFNEYAFDPEPASMGFVRSTGSAGRYTVEGGAVFSGEFKEPVGFREEIRTLTGPAPFFQVAWSGRGQMPIREVHATKYLTLWVGDVVLPAYIPTISGPNREYSGFIRSAPLSTVIDFVQTQVRKGMRRSGAAQNHPAN